MLITTLVIILPTTSLHGNQKILSFCPAKDDQFSLTETFLKQIKDIFDASSFVETGTYQARTTLAAANVFEKVYSAELSSSLYQTSWHKVLTEKKLNINLFCGSSIAFLNYVVPNLFLTTIFFLDAHWSGGITAKGESNTPILEELECIKINRLVDCVILIDDIRCFAKNNLNPEPSTQDYPGIDDLIQKGIEIFGELGLIMFGDIAIMYDANLHKIDTSPVISAMTKYKIASLRNEIFSPEEMQYFCSIIGKATNLELDGIKQLINLPPTTQVYVDYFIWKFFTMISKESNTQKATRSVNIAMENSQAKKVYFQKKFPTLANTLKKRPQPKHHINKYRL